jgi:hypothetical protein
VLSGIAEVVYNAGHNCSSLVSQRHHGIDAHRAAGGEEAREKGDEDKQHCGADADTGADNDKQNSMTDNETQ